MALSVKPDLIDVNVHPTKKQVIIERQDDLCELLGDLIDFHLTQCTANKHMSVDNKITKGLQPLQSLQSQAAIAAGTQMAQLGGSQDSMLLQHSNSQRQPDILTSNYHNRPANNYNTQKIAPDTMSSMFNVGDIENINPQTEYPKLGPGGSLT